MTENELNHGLLLKDWVHFLRIKPSTLLKKLDYQNHDNLYYYYGKKEIKLSVLQQWAEAFGITVDQLLAGTAKYRKPLPTAVENDNIPYQLHHGKQLENLIEEKGTNITHLAGELSMSRQNIYDLLKRSTFDDDLLNRLAHYFNVPITYFTGGGPRKGYYERHDVFKEIQFLEQKQNESFRQLEIMLNRLFAENRAAMEDMLKEYLAPGK